MANELRVSVSNELAPISGFHAWARRLIGKTVFWVFVERLGFLTEFPQAMVESFGEVTLAI